MVCFYPIKGFRAAVPNAEGRRPIFFKRTREDGMPIQLACGQCSGCRLERSRQWAVRCLHESKLYVDNCFITLTYSDSFLPPSRSLILNDFQNFMKRLRKRYGSGIRFFHCGEYGPKLGRPHYHALLFNFDFKDRKVWKSNERGELIYTSKDLEKLWPLGFSTVAALTFDSAAYCARYAMKKITGDMARDHYAYVDPVSGEYYDRAPEYCTMSRRPGIGRGHFDKFVSDVYPSDFIIVNGKKARPPRFYDSLYEHLDPLGLEEVKNSRVANAERHADNNTPERLKVREEVLSLKLKQLKRGW